MNLRQVEFAIALNLHRSFVRAAESVNVTQPTFSRGIAALEKRLGTQLFTRSKRKVEPTPAGLRLVERGSTLLSEASRIRQELLDIEGGRVGHLSIGSGPLPLEICVIPALSRVMASHPKVTLNLLEGRWREFVQLLLTGQIDIAVLEASVLINDHRLTVQPLPRHRTCFYCRAGHPLAARRSVSIRDLAAFPLIAVPLARSIMPNESIQAFRQTIEPATGDIMSPVTVTSLTAMREIVQRSDGIGFSVSSQIVQDVKVGSLVVLRTSFELPSTGYGVAWLKDRKLSWIAEAFVQTLHHVEVDVARGKVGSVQQRRKSRRHRQARA